MTEPPYEICLGQETNEIDETHQIDEINETDETDETDQSRVEDLLCHTK